MFVSVIIQNSSREYDRFYDYRVPQNLETYIQPGIRVLVPFGRGESIREGFVIEVKQESAIKGLKSICQVIDETPVLTPELMQLSQLMKKRYICTHDLAIRCMIPAGLGLLYRREVKLRKDEGTGIETETEQQLLDILKQHEGPVFIDQLQETLKKPVVKLLNKMEERNLIEIVNHYQMKARAKTIRVALPALEFEEYQEMLDNNQIRNLKYMRLMEMLYEEEQIPVNELNAFGYSSAVLKNMEKKGFIAFSEEPVDRNPLDTVEVEKTGPMTPTPCQRRALDVIFKALSKNASDEILLHGVTGSGKTEVYLQVIQQVIRQGKTAIMLVPEIGLTPQTMRQFKARFGDGVAVLHSRLSMGERFDQWNRIRDGAVKVVVGARSAVFAPLTNLGVIIIDEEHETSYKSDRTPKYDARTIAAARCRFSDALLIYGSATPSVENYWRAVSGKIKLVEMLERTNNCPLPEVLTVDMRIERENGLRSELSGKLIAELQKNKTAGEQTILFINRRGHSHFLLCKKCGFIAACPYCSVSLTWHQAEKRLVCHYCGYTTTKPAQCPSCKDENVELYGAGTQKVEEMLPYLEPGYSVIRMDFDTTGGKLGHQKILDAFREQKLDIMVGTQMIAKGHDFPDVTLVGIINADSLLGSGDYRASERTFQLITQASGRAGRAEKRGRVVLQTHNPDEFSIQAAIRQDYRAFFQQEINLRRQLQLPPFFQFGLIQISGKEKDAVQARARQIHSDILRKQEFNSGLFLSEPSPSPVAKIKNRFRWRIILKHPSVKVLGTVLEWVFDTYAGGGKNEFSVSVDINPASML
ncbi:MAG: primosomal protein N' [Thermoclostridium sp.]|nr:primosomal protein N' [Thermoclostridium sp.]